MRRGLLTLGMILMTFAAPVLAQSPSAPVDKRGDAEQLGKALEYFTSGKYHESLLILQELGKHYKLNPRYKAYLGVSAYYEWDYELAVKCLDEAIPLLAGFAPHERSFYYWADAESHFALEQYAPAIPLYQEMLKLCHANERGDACYRLGFCYLFHEDWTNAWTSLLQARECYGRYPGTTAKARIVQIDNMLKGLSPKVAGVLAERLSACWHRQSRKAANP